MNVFVTGGAGYIGSHTCVQLLEKGHQVVIYDNLSNSNKGVLNRIQEITGKEPIFIEGDVRNQKDMETALLEHKCNAVIHFAGLKAVGESVEKPLYYYDHNVNGTLCLLRAMQNVGVNSFIFSSSATVYGDPEFLPLTEAHSLSAINPYGRSKLMVEDMLRDLVKASSSFKFGILRYFNPVGAHESGLIGEDPKGIPNNLFPFVSQVALGKREALSVWGDDYETKDGTGVRDYIHVVDLAAGHLCALEKLASEDSSFTVNLGTGQGYSVLEVVQMFETVSGQPVPYKLCPRRQGDVASCYADVKYAKELLGWSAQKTLKEMCEDGWRWQEANPQGYI